MDCAPDVKKRCKKCKSCFDKNDLIKIVKAYNKKNPSKKIIIKGKTHTQLWNAIRKALSKKCNKEVCWMEEDFLKGSKLIERFKPKMPSEWKKNKYTWLSTTDINAVMKQYERMYDNFAFFGPVPVDCPNGITCELTYLNPLELRRKNNTTMIGIIFNLDYHYQSGSHWVALMIDMSKSPHYIDYFDSYGEEPHKLIKQFMNQMYDKIKSSDETLRIINDKRHQYGHSECGIYSINYLLERLKGRSPYDLTKYVIKDSVMNEMRKYLYRN